MGSSGTIRVLGSTHPLRNELQQVEVPASVTVAEALELALFDAKVDWPRDMIVASVGGVRIPRENWARVRPKPGTTVVFRPVAGDDKFLRSALGFAVAIAALFIAPILAPGIAAGLGIGVSTATALVGAALTIGGTLLINALIPVRPAQIGSQDNRTGKSLVMIGGAQNEARPWDPIPVILGRHRISPMYAAKPYTQFAGNKQFVNMLFCVGYGRLSITQRKIGETVTGAFEEIDEEVREGTLADTPTTLFPVAVDETTLSITLRQVDGFNARTTAPDTDSIAVDLIAPQGIFSYDSSTGIYEDRPVTINLRYRRVGTVPWTNRPDIVFTRSRDAYRKGDRWDVSRGQYEVQVAKSTADYAGTGQVAEEIQWIALRTFTHAHPVTFPKPLALIAVRIRATDQLNGIVSTYNVVAQSYVKGYNGSSWHDDVLSSNPADLFRHVLQGPANARPRTDDQIDLASLEDWWSDCVANGYTYNAVQAERRSVREILADIASAGRAMVAYSDGKWGVRFPRVTDPVVWHFNPRNMTSFSTERTYRTMPHALRVRYIDQDHGWRERERIVYADGYGSSNATLFEQIEMPGITQSSDIWKHGRYQIAQALLRPEQHTMGSDIESLRLQRGDKVEVADDVLLIGTGYGRVVGVDSVGQSVLVDSKVIMEFGSSYQIRFRLADGTALTRNVFNTVNETDQIFLDPDLTTDMPAVGDLFSFGETELVTRNYRVFAVGSGSDLSAQILLVDDAPEIDDADTGTIPDYDPGITDPPDPYSLTPAGLQVSEFLSGSGITVKSIVQVTVQVPRVGRIRAFEFQFKDLDAGGDYRPFATVAAPLLTATRQDLEPGSWQFRVRSLFDDGDGTTKNDASAWVESDVTSLLGVLAPPGDVENLRIASIGDVTRLNWDAVSAANLKGYVVKYSSVTDGSATWGASLTLVSPITNYAEIPTRSGTYSVKAVTWSDVESVNATFLPTFVEGPQQNVVEAVDEDPLFSGLDVNTQSITGDILTLTFDTSGFYVAEGTYYFAGSVDLGTIYTSRIEAVVEASGLDIGNTMDTWANLADLEALDNTDPSSWHVDVLYRWTNDDPASTGATWSDWAAFSIADVTARGLEFAARLTGSPDGRISPAITRLGVVVDMPDRHVGYKDQQSGTAAGGFTITFDPIFKALKDVTVVVHDLNTTAGEKFEVVSKDASHVTVRAKNSSGVAVDRKFDLHAFGYGQEIPLVT